MGGMRMTLPPHLATAAVSSLHQLAESPSSLGSVLPPLLRLFGQSASRALLGGARTSIRQAVCQQMPEENKKPPTQMIEDVGLEAEEHKVVTEDGYILTVHRILNGDPSSKPVVFMQHGLLSSSADWLMQARNKALAFLLADAGYDVWLGNFRGNTYSRSHETLDPEHEEFWRYSFHEMGLMDLPAMLLLVLAVTGKEKIAYVGHSMGTAAFWVMCDQRPWMNDKISVMVGMAPVAAVVPHQYSPLHYVVPVAGQVEGVMNLLGIHEFLARDSFLGDLSETLYSSVSSLVSGGSPPLP